MTFLFYLLVSDTYPDGCFVLGRKTQSFQIRRVLHLRVESAPFSKGKFPEIECARPSAAERGTAYGG